MPNSSSCRVCCHAVSSVAGVAVRPISAVCAPRTDANALTRAPHVASRWWHSSSTSVHGPSVAARSITALPLGCRRSSNACWSRLRRTSRRTVESVSASMTASD
ncbi:Uncharacterised protein [Mycobacterium tuberculosis]|nr:Uncharacterised protein [Mycobacterium tuberculosis]COY18470.1 Uncharacterised protein [Mycobacterium tuberculosis]